MFSLVTLYCSMCNIALVTFLRMQYWSASMINIYEHRKTCFFCVLSLMKPTSVLKFSKKKFGPEISLLAAGSPAMAIGQYTGNPVAGLHLFSCKLKKPVQKHGNHEPYRHGRRLDSWHMATMPLISLNFYPAPDRGTGYCLRSIYLFIYLCLCFFVSKITRKLLDRFAWNFQGRCRVTLGQLDSILGQFGETMRCRNSNFYFLLHHLSTLRANG